MPGPTIGSDKCQEDKCLNPQVQAFVHRGICPLQAFVLRGICPTGGQMPVQAFVLPGICLSRHLSANPLITILLLLLCPPSCQMWVRERCRMVTGGKSEIGPVQKPSRNL